MTVFRKTDPWLVVACSNDEMPQAFWVANEAEKDELHTGLVEKILDIKVRSWNVFWKYDIPTLRLPDDLG